MSDFGTDYGNASLSLMGKFAEALLKLFEKVFDTLRERTSAEYKLKKAELKSINEAAEQKQFAAKVEGMSGFINHDTLVKAGIPLVSCGLALDDNAMKELSARCKREGILITGLEDIRARELSGNKMFMIECKQADLQKLANLVDLMNDEKKIGLIQDEIGKIESSNASLKIEYDSLKSKEELTSGELERVNEIESEMKNNNSAISQLYSQIDNIRYGHSQELNLEQSQGIVEKAVNGSTQRGVSFDEALDRWTGGKIDEDTTCYVVDAKDPDCYIVCNAKNDIYKEQEYIKTSYEVYNGDECVYSTDDGRFDGRTKDYWANEKNAMKAAGGFGDTVLKFYSAQELEAYRESYKDQNASELSDLDVGTEGRDYDEIIKSLEAKLDENGAKYHGGNVFDKDTSKLLELTPEMNESTKANVAESVVIGKQIDNYKELKQLEGDVAIARTNILTAPEGSDEQKAAQTEFAVAENKLKSALKTEESLIEERKSVNAVQAHQEASGHERKDDRRSERVNETHEKGRALSEYKGEIGEKRKNNHVKESAVKDKAEKAKTVVPKNKTER